MRSFILKPAFLAFLLIAISLEGIGQQGIKTKDLSREFDVNSNATLLVDNSFGKVHCSAWDKNKISIVAEIKVEAKNDKTAQEVLDKISCEISGNANLVEIKTRIGNSTNNSQNKSFSINYTINMPASVLLDISNKFGDVFIDKTTSASTINVDYGNLTILEILNPGARINLKFSAGNIEKMGRINLDLQYSSLKLGTAEVASVDSKFSTLNFSQSNSISIKSEYDTWNVGKVSGIDGYGKFTTLNIGELINRLDLDMQYGGLDVKNVNPTFSQITINSSFNSIKLGIPRSASYRLEASTSFGDCQYPSGSKVQVTEKSITSKTYSGVVGQLSNPTAKVTVSAKNSDVRLF